MISGFLYGHQPIDWSVVVAVFFITSMAMLINDYHDREIDVAKGKLLASSQPVWFLRYAVAFAVISLGLCLVVWSRNSHFGMLCVGMWITSIAYNKAQRNPVAKNIIVSINVGATILFPLLAGSKVFELWIMAVLIVLIITVREYMKDVEDMEVDRGKKRTLALVMNSRIRRDSAIRWKHLMTLLLVALMVGCAINY
ncbi:MAG: UbiA family prenyltransferase [Candidatus Vogelbacteria bacterium]|nr:UbiA family prenyltransferase [Candidatus Vogelbacteria bacterium]